MKFHFEYTTEEIRGVVVMETSYIAERQPDLAYPETTSGGNNIFEILHIFDEHYDELYHRYLDEAYSQLVLLVPVGSLADEEGTIVDEDVRAIYFDIKDYPRQLIPSLRLKMRQFIIEHILWAWFKTKLPHLAKVFNESMQETRGDISKLLNRRTRPLRRISNFP